MDQSNYNLTSLREIILNFREPHIIRNMKIPWKCFQLSFSEWCQLYDTEIKKKSNNAEDEETIKQFETASKMFFDCPQWERFRKLKPISFKDFYEKTVLNEDEFFKNNWIGYNYKNIEDMPKICKDGITFSHFGFQNVDDDITFWLGSKGAHTPCHYDSYGCNIVVQVYGRKQWLLFPPTTDFTPVRIPYEESSVYCSEVLYSPNFEDASKYENISGNCYKCVLEPGDILVVPYKWWHYVENLSTALSVNCWIPLENDTQSQLDECIVKFLIEAIINDSSGLKNEFLNPNEEMVGEELILHLIEHLSNGQLYDSGEPFNKLKSKKYPYQYLSVDELEKLIKSISNEVKFDKIEKCTKEQFYDILKLNSKKRYKTVEHYKDSLNNDSNSVIKAILINSICDPKMIEKIKQNFLKRFSKNQKLLELCSTTEK